MLAQNSLHKKTNMNITETRCGQELVVETQQVCAGTDTNGQNEQSFDFIVNGTRSPNPGFKTKGNNRSNNHSTDDNLRLLGRCKIYYYHHF